MTSLGDYLFCISSSTNKTFRFKTSPPNTAFASPCRMRLNSNGALRVQLPLPLPTKTQANVACRMLKLKFRRWWRKWNEKMKRLGGRHVCHCFEYYMSIIIMIIMLETFLQLSLHTIEPRSLFMPAAGVLSLPRHNETSARRQCAIACARSRCTPQA